MVQKQVTASDTGKPVQAQREPGKTESQVEELRLIQTERIL